MNSNEYDEGWLAAANGKKEKDNPYNDCGNIRFPEVSYILDPKRLFWFNGYFDYLSLKLAETNK
jgi:hypothetical protein